MAGTPLKMLIVEDNLDDAALVAHALEQSDRAVSYERVETAEQLLAALSKHEWDIVIADYTLPRFSAMDALAIVRRHNASLPFIVVSGKVGEDVAAEAMRAGAQDYVLKSNLQRLLPAVRREIAEAEMRRQHADSLYRLSYHDPLTGLPNRVLMMERLEQALAHAGECGETLTIALVDLDHFKNISDSLGHKAADNVLIEVARRLTAVLRREDTVARLGGDEFVLILPGISQEQQVTAIAQQVRQALSLPIETDGHVFHTSASLGIALFPRDGVDADVMLRNADTAMYEAKEAGRDTYRFYEVTMHARVVKHLELEHELRGALERGELEVYYQPQVDLDRDGRITSFEALLRWNHPRRGLICPDDFIPLAEETGLIVPIGDWVMEQACRCIRNWAERFDLGLRVAVNLSARQFSQPDLPQKIAAILKATNLPAKNLEVELTESLVMRDITLSTRMLAELKTMGVMIAVDDFGTGYSSLSYLKRFPIDIIKIDKSFVGEISSNPDDAAICQSIIAMGHSLRLKVIAEGVETEGQLGFLAQQRCDRVQGYLFSPAVTVEAAEALLASGRKFEILAPPSGAPERVLLLLDDEENILTSLKRLFRRDGYRILTANNAATAFELLAANKVGVIISDQRMPNMTGTEFLHRVKELYPDNIRIVLSGYTELQSVIEAINQGAIYRFLTKPWDDDHLRAAIREAFRHQEMAQENIKLNDQFRDASWKLCQSNELLQDLLNEKSNRIARNETMIGATREAFFRLPVPLIGVDDEGLLALSNAKAQLLWPAALPGADIHVVLPPEINNLFGDGKTATLAVTISGHDYFAHCERLDAHAGGAGWLLTLLPTNAADLEATLGVTAQSYAPNLH